MLMPIVVETRNTATRTMIEINSLDMLLLPCRYAACAALTSSTGCHARCPTPWPICWRHDTPVAETRVPGAASLQRREQP